jgi:hypothetical protein
MIIGHTQKYFHCLIAAEKKAIALEMLISMGKINE